MASPVGSLFNTHAVRVEEKINKSLEVLLPAFEPLWEDTVASSQGVGSADDLGRDFLIRKTYTGGLTGVLEPGGPTGDFMLYGDPSNTAIGAKLFAQGLNRTFPDATQGMNQAAYRLCIPLRSMLANIMLTLAEMRAEATDAVIGEVVAPKLEGFARHMTQLMCLYWYVSQNSYYALASLQGAVNTNWNSETVGGVANTRLMIDLAGATDANFAVDRFMVGMRLQIYDSTGVTLRTTASMAASTVWVVVAVDEGACKVYLQPANGVADVDETQFADGDIIVLAGSKGSASTPYSATPYFTGFAGFNSWMKFGDPSTPGTNGALNCLLGDERVATDGSFSGVINVDIHPEFKSHYYDLSGAPLTEHTLRKILRRFHTAKRKYGQFVDCLVASDGVWLSYEAQKIGRQWYDRTGRLSSLKNEGSQEGFEFTLDGRSYQGYTSEYISQGQVVGLRKKGNWKRYTPPDPRGTKKFDRAKPFIPFRFVGNALTGTGSNQIPISIIANNRTLVTEGTQLPGYLCMQMVPEQPAGFRIDNVAEDRTYVSTPPTAAVLAVP